MLSSVLVVMQFWLASAVMGQATTERAADLIVDGKLKRVFQGETQYVMQVEVRSATLPGGSLKVGADYPAPGQNLYVHVEAGLGRGLPKEGSQVRFLLSLNRDNEWIATNDGMLLADSSGPLTELSDETSKKDKPILGVATELVSLGLGGRRGLKVTAVIPDSPAARAGLESGDIVVAVGGRPVESKDELAVAYKQTDGNLRVTVRNVRTGEDVDVEVGSGQPPVVAPPGRGGPSMRPLGLTTELAFLRGEPVLKVTNTQPGSPAARAGLKEGQLIVIANGKRMSKPQDLTDAERQSSRLELGVVDPEANASRISKVVVDRD